MILITIIFCLIFYFFGCLTIMSYHLYEENEHFKKLNTTDVLENKIHDTKE